MNILGDILTYIRRIIKSPSNASITDSLLIDYVNRFWIMDVDARMQLFDLKKKYQFQTTPAVDQYNMPLYSLQTESPGSDPQDIQMYPVYQGFQGPAYVNGIEVQFYTQRSNFFSNWPNVVQNLQPLATGDGSTLPFSLNFNVLNNTLPANPPVNGLIRGHVDLQGVIATGNNVDPPLSGPTFNTNIPITSVDAAVWITSQAVDGSNIVISDSGQFLTGNVNYGLLMARGPAGAVPNAGCISLGTYDTTHNTINYLTGECNVTFPIPPADGAQINGQVLYFQSGIPRGILFYNNTLTLRSPPSQQWLVELDAYMSPAAFLNTTDAVAFGYMAEYIARGAARKILSDTGDVEQFQFYEPLFREQENLVWKRSQRQWTSTRTQTIYSQGLAQGQISNNVGGSTQ